MTNTEEDGVSKPWRDMQEGDGWRMYLGDCREVMPTIGRFDAVVTDPPYGIGEARSNNHTRSVLARSRDYGESAWDDKPCDSKIIDDIRAISNWQIIFGGNYFTLPPSRCWLVWDKMNGENDFADCELAWTNLDKAVRRIRFMWHGMLRDEPGERYHPTQKPVGVMRWCLGHLPLGTKTILDPMCGVGTTGVACIETGRMFVGIEIDERYFRVACNRLRSATPCLFGAKT